MNFVKVTTRVESNEASRRLRFSKLVDAEEMYRKFVDTLKATKLKKGEVVVIKLYDRTTIYQSEIVRG